MSELDEDRTPGGSDAGRWLVIGAAGATLALILAGIVFKPKPAPPEESIAGDPLLVLGHGLYQQRCYSCHGARGKGDGPIADSLEGAKPGDWSGGKWEHCSTPEEMISLIAKGVPGTAMGAWTGEYDDAQIRAMAAFVYHLAGQAVPDSLREPAKASPAR